MGIVNSCQILKSYLAGEASEEYMQGVIMNKQICKKPKTRQEKLRYSYWAILCFSGAIIISRIVAKPSNRWIWAFIIWGTVALLYVLKFIIFKDKVLGKEPEGEEGIMEDKSKSE